MSLEQFKVARDHFQYNENDGSQFDFPCCVCKFVVRDSQEFPCRVCDHNINAVKEETTHTTGENK